MTFKDTLRALLVVVIWGLNFPIIKIGLEELPPILFSALRFAIVALPLVFFIPLPKTSKWNVMGVGVFMGILMFGILFIAMKSEVSAGLSSLILQAQVFFTIGFSILFFNQTISKTQLWGIGVAVIGFMSFFFNTGENVTWIQLISA